MTQEHRALEGYEDAVAGLVAHAALHAPHDHQEELRELVIRGERTLCKRCQHLREALLHAATTWRAAMKRSRKSEPIAVPEAIAGLERLGLTG